MRTTCLLSIIKAAIVVALTASSASCWAAVVWDEGIQGDLSGDRSAPTSLSFSAGSNELIATSSGGDIEYVTFAIPAGQQLNSVILSSYSGLDGTAFFGLQKGATFTEPPNGTVVGNLLGYTHFGPAVGNVGGDILSQAGSGAGAQGFTPPLAADSYSVWLQ
jgi:hypothetical protein